MSIISASDALVLLKKGNERFVKGKSVFPHISTSRIHEISKTQMPFATILGCVDSRVPPEIVFDQGLGDLFIVRTAGQVLDTAVLGSIEYGVMVLNIPLVIVMGHSHCGAVKAALHSEEDHTTLPYDIDYLRKQMIIPLHQAIDTYQADSSLDLINTAVVKQIEYVAQLLSENIKVKEATIVKAYYDLDSGKVTFF